MKASPTRPPTASRVAHWITFKEEQHREWQKQYLSQLCEADQEIREANELIQEFTAMLRERKGEGFDTWLEKVEQQGISERYSLFNEAALLQVQGIERNILALLRKHSSTHLANKKILDIGCGSGILLQRFLSYGAKPHNFSGIDLLPARIEQAQSLNPIINWQIGSAHQLPYPKACFDLVTLSVVFSSILNASLRQAIADEVWRVCKPDGLILYYDFAYTNPQNHAVKGISRQEMQQLFKRPGACFDVRRITLAPPLSRLIAPRAYWVASSLEHLQIFNTHLLCAISLGTHTHP